MSRFLIQMVKSTEIFVVTPTEWRDTRHSETNDPMANNVGHEHESGAGAGDKA
jgi:hypothetical protein